MTLRMTPEQYDRLQKRPARGKNAVIVNHMAEVQAPKKFRNRPTGGYASVKEARRAEQLKLMLAAGEIRNLREQVPFILIPAQYDANRKLLERQCVYIADFVYNERCEEGRVVCLKPRTISFWTGDCVEDVKGVRTPDYVIKRKLLLEKFGLRIRET